MPAQKRYISVAIVIYTQNYHLLLFVPTSQIEKSAHWGGAKSHGRRAACGEDVYRHNISLSKLLLSTVTLVYINTLVYSGYFMCTHVPGEAHYF